MRYMLHVLDCVCFSLLGALLVKPQLLVGDLERCLVAKSLLSVYVHKWHDGLVHHVWAELILWANLSVSGSRWFFRVLLPLRHHLSGSSGVSDGA